MFVLRSPFPQQHRSLGYESKATKQTFIVAFEFASHARRVRSSIDRNPRLRLERGKIVHDISDRVSSTIGMKMPPILVDTTSILHIHKSHPDISDFHMYQMSTEEVCMMPLERNIGVIMPRKLISEDAETMTFQCRVIDPCSSVQEA